MSQALEDRPILEMRGIYKSFPGVQALQDVSFSLLKGEVHGLLGENGAGKSTLMKILSGAYRNYEGTIELDGQTAHFRNEKDALRAGISIVAQELNPIPDLTIAENVFIGRERTRSTGLLDRNAMQAEVSALLEAIGLPYQPGSKMRRLSVAGCQMVEIVRAVSQKARIIIMDEPTSALTGAETQTLFKQIKKLKAQGVTIVFISHKLDEVLAICDRVTVLRDGKLIATAQAAELDHGMLIKMMAGREISNLYPTLPPASGETLLQAEGLSRRGAFREISFEVRKGEILGVAGMVGAGRSEIMRAIFGLDKLDSGCIKLNGRQIKIKTPHDAIQNGVVMVTEDRSSYGFVGQMSVLQNNLLPNTDFFSSGAFLRYKDAGKASEDICERLKVKAPGQNTLVRTLSGGNQQKIVLGKWLMRDIQLVIMDEPTRGIDVGAKYEIYQLMVSLILQGISIIMVSSEMSEVMGMSHRMLVIANGVLAGELQRGEFQQERIMELIVKGEQRHAEA